LKPRRKGGPAAAAISRDSRQLAPLTKEADQHSEAERDEAKHGLDL
jgi:hypothetical protein